MRFKLLEDRGSSRPYSINDFLKKLTDNRLIRKYFINDEDITDVYFSSVSGSKNSDNKNTGKIIHHYSGFHDSNKEVSITAQQHGEITDLAIKYMQAEFKSNPIIIKVVEDVYRDYIEAYNNVEQTINNINTNFGDFINFSIEDIKQNITTNAIREIIRQLKEDKNLNIKNILEDSVYRATTNILNK